MSLDAVKDNGAPHRIWLCGGEKNSFGVCLFGCKHQTWVGQMKLCSLE
jgi:hypothetical protein